MTVTTTHGALGLDTVDTLSTGSFTLSRGPALQGTVIAPFCRSETEAWRWAVPGPVGKLRSDLLSESASYVLLHPWPLKLSQPQHLRTA